MKIWFKICSCCSMAIIGNMISNSLVFADNSNQPNNDQYINTLLQPSDKASFPDTIDSAVTYEKRKFNLSDHKLQITSTGSLSFKDSTVSISKGEIINSNPNSPIEFKDSSRLVASGTHIRSKLVLENSSLFFEEGSIDHFIISGKADAVVKEASFNTIEFNQLGSTDGSNFGVAFDKIFSKQLNINIEGLQNDVNRKINFRDVNIDKLVLKGTISVEQPPKSTPGEVEDKPSVDKPAPILQTLNTGFNYFNSDIGTLEYLDDTVTKRVNLLNTKPTGYLNFINSDIQDLKVSYNLLRGITFNGVHIKALTIEHVNLAEPEAPETSNIINKTDNKPEGTEKAPKAPTYSNLQLAGLGITYIENLNLNGAKIFKTEGEIGKGGSATYNPPISSIYIKSLSGYSDTDFSFYSLRNVFLGVERPTTKTDEISDAENHKPHWNAKTDIAPGGNQDTINIGQLYKVTTFGVQNQTVKLNWALTPHKKYGYNQHLSLFNVSELMFTNSLLDISATADLQPNIKPTDARDDTSLALDPRKFDDIYDLNITYAIDRPTLFGSVLYFDNSGAIKNNKRGEYIDLRIKTQGYSFVTAKDMLSNLHMQLNGEYSIFVLESNKYNKDYTFHTNYNFQFLDPVGGSDNQIYGSPRLDYRYWDYNENSRVEQNFYTFQTDIVIVDKNKKPTTDKNGNVQPTEYEVYKNSLPPDQQSFGTAWFTYWQPYKVDKDGNPAKDGTRGDQCAWDQGTDGSGRGGFPCEFGNGIKVEDAKLTFLQPLDNLTALEVVGTGEADFSHMDSKHVSSKDSQWITYLRMRAGTLTLAKVPMYVDKLLVYEHKYKNAVVFRPIYEVKEGSNTKDVLDQQRLVVNKEADFKGNQLTVDLYFNNFFLGLDNSVTLNILELGEYQEKVKEDKENNKPEYTVIKQAVVKNLSKVTFAQGLLFDTNYYWKDNKLFAVIKRTKRFGDFITNSDRTISNVLDQVIAQHEIAVDKEGKIQFLKPQESLNSDTLKIINELFKLHDQEELSNAFISLRPINNELAFHTTNLATTKLLAAVKNSNNYTIDKSNSKLVTWANYNMGDHTINNTKSVLGTSINSQTLVVGAHNKHSRFKLGAFVGYVNSKLESAYLTGHSPTIGGGIYSNMNFNSGYFLQLATSYNTSTIDAERQLFLNEQAKAKILGRSVDISLYSGKNYQLSNEFGYITPFISLNSGYISFKDYTESGSSATYQVKGFNAPYVSAQTGLEYAKALVLSDSGVLLVPKAGIRYGYQYYHITDTKAYFNKINGIAPKLNQVKYSSNNYDKNSLYLNAGLALNTNLGSLTADFNAELWNRDISGYTIFVGYKYSF